MSVVNSQGNSSSIQPTQGGVDVFALKNQIGTQQPSQGAAVKTPVGTTEAGAVSTSTSVEAQSLDARQKQVNDALDAILKKLEPRPKTLQFSVNRVLDQIVVKVIDTQSRKVVYQIPSEAILKASEQLQSLDSKKMPVGALFSEQA